MRQALLLFCLALAAGVVYYLYDPAASGFFPQCPFRALTGWECPGCGSQRAVHCLLHGDFPGALRQNALLVLSLPLLLALLCAEVFRKQAPAFYRKAHRPAGIYAYLALVLLWWAGRNMGGF